MVGFSTASAKASVDDVLVKLHDRGKDLQTLAADVRLSTQDASLGDDPDTRIGTLVFNRLPEGDTRVRATFTRRERGKRVEEARKEYLIDGTKLVERDYAAKKQTTRIIGKPGEKLDLFKLGQGPFPLPIGQPPEEVKKEFEVKTGKAETPTPGLNYIELIPRKDRPIADKFSSVLVGVDKDGWPVEVETLDKNATNLTRVELTNIRTNQAVNDKAFSLEPIDDTWNKVDESYRG
jgi:hypothetical protein